MIFPLYVEQLDYIHKVTEILNTNVPNLPDGAGYCLRVEVLDEQNGTVLGHWSDEIASDCWAFEASNG